MNIIDLIEQDGGILEKVSTTNGGEWSGPCPWCGGSDGFRVWPYHNGGRYWCRRCDKAGDSIEYLRVRRGLSYQDACLVIGKSIGPCGPARSKEKSNKAWIPKESTIPPAAWQEEATSHLETFQEHLFSDQGQQALHYLHGRGLTDETIKAANIGLNILDRYRDRESWGLSTEFNENGRRKKVKISAGLVIPYIVDGNIQRLRIRSMKADAVQKYSIVSGSATAPIILSLTGPHAQAGNVIAVESELDGLLLHQKAGDIVTVIALGSASIHPDIATDIILQQANMILLALDNDEAGNRASLSFWLPTYGEKVKRWPVPIGKDPSEAYQQGIDLRLWIQAGLMNDSTTTDTKGAESVMVATSILETWEGMENVFPFPVEWLNQFNECQLERLAIMTIDGGLSDDEALKAMAR